MVQWGTKTAKFWEDREEAGQELAEKLTKYADDDTVVLGLPRGGVITAAEVARSLEVPLGLAIARKIGHPSNPEYAIAAVSEKGEPVINYTEQDNVDPKWFEAEVKNQRAEVARRRKLYLEDHKQLKLTGKIVIIVDDGVATGLTIRATIEEARAAKPKMIIVAVPVAPEESASEIASEVDKFICLHIESTFFSSVSNYYSRFEQIDDDEVVSALAEAEEVA